MSKKIFSFLIFAIFLFSSCTTFTKELARCGDCTEVADHACKIEGRAGYFVAYIAKPSWESSFDFPLFTSAMGKCLPSDLHINADDGYKYICVWSRELGCQLIAPPNEEEIACGNCRSDPDKGCPCKVKKHEDTSRSERLHTSSKQVIVGASFVGLITYIWK